ncbi:MAG: AAA family ATPase [Nitrospira sp.]
MTLTPQDFNSLERESWIDQTTADRFGLRRVNSCEGAALVGHDTREDYAGIAFPVYWPENPKPRESYLRRDRPPIENGKPKGKYLAPPGRGNMLLFGPGESVEALTDAERPIILVEGLKKLLAAYRLVRHNSERPQFLPCAISGVWNWKGTIGKATDAGGSRVDEKGVIPDFNRISWTGRTVIVIFDSDCATNEKVNAARRGLIAELKKRGARAVALDLPALDGLDKTGLDDLLAQRGPEHALSLIHAALTSPADVVTTGAAVTVTSRARFRRVSDIQAKPIYWLWRGRFARGKVSMIAGNPGLGKSQVTASMAAIVSTGGRWPVDGTLCELGNVVILSAEDDPSDTLRPRLEAAGANLSRVFILDAVTDGTVTNGNENRRGFNLKSDLSQLGAMLEEIGGAALIVIDPITAYLGTTDSHKNAEIRALLSPLVELAANHEAAVVCVSHFNKNSSGEVLMRVTGSLAFVAAARAAFVVTKDLEQDARRLFLPLKNNLGNDQTGLAFTVEPIQLESPQGPIETSRVIWQSETVTTTAQEAMAQQDTGEERGDLDDARGFLRELLAKGPLPTKQIQKDAEGAGYAWRTIQRAKKLLGVTAKKEGMKEGWSWSLDGHSRPAERHNTPKSATSGEWPSSYSSAPVGGLRSDDKRPVQELSKSFNPELPLMPDEMEEVVDL